MSDELNPEDVIRRAGRIGDSLRRPRHPYVSMDQFEDLTAANTTWAAGITSSLTEWAAQMVGVMEIALQAQDVKITELAERVAELELRARTRDDYEAEMRDRG